MSGFWRIITFERARRPGGRSLAFQLGLLCLVLLLPMLLILALFLNSYVKETRERLGETALEDSRTLANNLDQELLRLRAVLGVLGDSTSLAPLDLPGFTREARLLERRLGIGVRLSEGAGLVLLDGSSANGLKLDVPAMVGATTGPAGGPGISNLIAGPGGVGGVFLVSETLRREGEPARLLSLVVPVSQLQSLFGRHRLPDGWIAMVSDENGVVLSRSEDNEAFVGYRFSPPTLARMVGPEGLWVTRNLAGERVIATYSKASVVGWRAGIILPVAQAELPLWHSVTLLAVTSLALILLALGLALFFARRIARPVKALAEAAGQLGQGAPLPALPAKAPTEIAAVGAALGEAQAALIRRSEANARDESRLRRAVAAAGVGTWEWDAVADRLTGSPGREALYGRPPGDVPDRMDVLAATHPADREILQRAMAEALLPGGNGEYAAEFRVVWPDRQVRWLHSMGGVVDRLPDGRVQRLAGVVMDVTARHEAVEREKLLASEVDHRARNVLAVVQSIIRLSRVGDPRHFATVVEGRVAALARAHTLLARDRWRGGELRQMLTEELAPYLGDARVLLEGPAVLLSPNAVQPLAMVLHELLTNAAKYGALSVPGGQVALRWLFEGNSLLLLWSERGGPAVPTAPLRGGFGGKLIEATLRGQLGGRVEWNWAAEGLSCRVSLPTDRVLRDQGAGIPEVPVASPSPPPQRSLTGLRVLLAEDEALVAMEMEATLRDFGCTVIGPAATAEAAQRLAASGVVDIAVLDVNLGGQPSFPAADILLARGVPVVFATGYGELQGRSENSKTLLLRKPLDQGALEAALRRLLPPDRPVDGTPERQRRAG